MVSPYLSEVQKPDTRNTVSVVYCNHYWSWQIYYVVCYIMFQLLCVVLCVVCCVLRHVGAQEVLMMGPRRPRHLSLISCNN